jgi:hypothetical protein
MPLTTMIAQGIPDDVTVAMVNQWTTEFKTSSLSPEEMSTLKKHLDKYCRRRSKSTKTTGVVVACKALFALCALPRPVVPL